jgi:hypothetical protein
MSNPEVTPAEVHTLGTRDVHGLDAAAKRRPAGFLSPAGAFEVAVAGRIAR